MKRKKKKSLKTSEHEGNPKYRHPSLFVVLVFTDLTTANNEGKLQFLVYFSYFRLEISKYYKRLKEIFADEDFSRT